MKFRFLLTSLLALALISTAFAQEDGEESSRSRELVDAKDFGRKLGRAKKDHMIEVGFMGGMSNTLYAYSVAYTAIVFDGIAAVTFPITVMQTSHLPEGGDNQMVLSNGENMLIGVGAKVRMYVNQIDEGLFYGGGGRIFHITSEYNRMPKSEGAKNWHYKFTYQNFTPLGEIGWQYKFRPEFGCIASGELGYQFTTYDELTNLDAGGALDNPKGDPGRTPLFGRTMVHWTINASIFYAF